MYVISLHTHFLQNVGLFCFRSRTGMPVIITGRNTLTKRQYLQGIHKNAIVRLYTVILTRNYSTKARGYAEL